MVLLVKGCGRGPESYQKKRNEPVMLKFDFPFRSDVVKIYKK